MAVNQRTKVIDLLLLKSYFSMYEKWEVGEKLFIKFKSKFPIENIDIKLKSSWIKLKRFSEGMMDVLMAFVKR